MGGFLAPGAEFEKKIFLIWSSGGPFVQRSGTICAILVEGIMRYNSVKLFEFGIVVQEEMTFKVISYLALWRLPLQQSGTVCAILVECIMQEEQFCQIILILDQWFRRRCHLKYFYWELWRPLCSLELNYAILVEGIMGNLHVK